MENKDMPAFPVKLKEGEKFDGMGSLDRLSKREYLSAMAMKGLLSCYEAQQDMQDDPRYNGENFKQVVALNSVEFADALMLELSKPQP